jgi:hypothetical protein
VTVIGWHGDPCSRCPSSRPGQPVRAAAHHGCCMPCWLGMSERQRRDALFDEGYDPPDARLTPAAAAECRVLEALLSMPAVDPPHEQQWGEAA